MDSQAEGKPPEKQAGPHQVYAASYGQNLEAVRGLVQRAVQSGDLRGDIIATDLLWALVGVASFGAGPNWQQSARKMVDILILGARPGLGLPPR